MTDLICEYTTKGDAHGWTCIGKDGALHLHIFRSEMEGWSGWQGGLEVHRRAPPSYRDADGKPDHADCWLLKGPCWHDGTSLYVSEVVIPYWQVDPDNEARMHNFMRREYAKLFEVSDGK